MRAAINAGNDASGHNRRTDVMSGDTDTTAAVEVHGRGGRGSAAVDVDERKRGGGVGVVVAAAAVVVVVVAVVGCVVAVAEAAGAGAERAAAGSSTLQGGGGGGGGRDPGAAVMCARCARSRRASAATQFCGTRENLDPGEPDARRSAAIDSGGGCGSGAVAALLLAVGVSRVRGGGGGGATVGGVAFCTLCVRRGVRVSQSSRAAVEAVPFPLAATAAGIDDPC